MATDPGDLVLDPDLRLRHDRLRRRAMGPTLDHHRHLAVALALARTRLMARAIPIISSPTAPKAAQGAGVSPASSRRHADAQDIRQGFVYERAPHITLKSIANNAEIDVI